MMTTTTSAVEWMGRGAAVQSGSAAAPRGPGRGLTCSSSSGERPREASASGHTHRVTPVAAFISPVAQPWAAQLQRLAQSVPCTRHRSDKSLCLTQVAVLAGMQEQGWCCLTGCTHAWTPSWLINDTQAVETFLKGSSINSSKHHCCVAPAIMLLC